MSEFEMENAQAFKIVHDNPRRRGIIRDVGYIINQDQAMEFAAFEALRNHNGSNLYGPVMLISASLIIICLTVSHLI